MLKNNSGRYSTMKNNHLQAVHDDDLSTLLISLGVYDEVCAGRHSCHFCQQSITLKNLGAIVPLNGNIEFSCDNPLCLKSMVEAGEPNDCHRN